MDDLISRQAAIDAFWSLDAELRPSAIGAILNMLKDLPSAERRGRWTTERTMEYDGEWYCSVCGYEPTVYEASNYCPNCGARMEADHD